jgi:ABC-type multidrug transport system fused ATPase/permease subunit
LQERTGYITQDPVIFNDSVFNNVTFWDKKTDANLQKYRKAIQQAAILDFIEGLPEKEDSLLGNNGTNLSGGQRQRISIARELYKNVEILILDEATSALDSETERAIQENIDELKGQYTILIVAHRISTIKNADRIVVMNNGEITNIGAFKPLMDSSPYFKKLVELQEV